MKYRVFLEQVEGDWFDDFIYISKYPLYNRGFEIIPFDGLDLNAMLNHNPNKDTDFIIASVEATGFFFKAINIEIPKYIGFPESIHKYLGRNITNTTLKDNSLDYPFFIKPSVNVKQFTGALVESDSSLDILRNFDNLTDDTPVYISEPIDIVSEYRCFINNKEVKGIQFYQGDFNHYIDSSILPNIINDYTDAPIAYTIDLGLLSNGETVIIEINDMWAIGSYGLDPKSYVDGCIKRQLEIKRY